MLKIFSHSALDCYRTCPRKFKFRYLEKPAVPDRVHVDAYLGSAVHRILRKLYDLGVDGVLMPLDKALQLYREEWEKVNREAIVIVNDFYTIDDYIRLGEEMLERHYNAYQPFKHGTLLKTEYNLVFELPHTSFKFRAIIDRLSRLDDGTVEICDYKTGKHITNPSEPAFFHQMGLYQVAVQTNYPEYEKIELAQHFLRQDQVVRNRMTPDEIDVLIIQLKDEIHKIIQSEKLDDFPTLESNLCKYCEYINLCPAKRHAYLLEQEQAEDISEVSLEKRAYELASQFLTIHQKLSELKSLHENLRLDLIELSKETSWSSLKGKDGKVQISLPTKEEFVTKTEDSGEFAELCSLARQLGLDEYFSIDGRALMKDIYLKRRLTDEQLLQLSKFVRKKEKPRVVAKTDRKNPEDLSGN